MLFITNNLNGVAFRRIKYDVGGFIELKRNLEKTTFYKKNTYGSKITGMILIIVGIIFLFLPFLINQKISASLIFIGIILILLINEKKTMQGINDIRLILIIVFLTWIVLMITINADFDLYIVLLTIGIFAIKEFLNEFLDVSLQKRVNLLFYVALIFFVIIMVKRIISLSGMYPS